MSVLAIVLIAVGVILLLLFTGGLIAANRRAKLHSGDLAQHLAEADRKLEQARAADKGWERVHLEEAARKVLAEQRPSWHYDRLDLVLVDDRPGVAEDTAQFLAVSDDAEVRIVLSRQDGAWSATLVE